MMQVGEVKVAEDADFSELKRLCTCHDGWKQEYSKNNVVVWTKANDVSDFKMIKVKAHFKDASACLVYDVLHDPDYRKTWDTSMLDGYEICCLNPNNDIGYYAMWTPKPLKNRDFVIQRSWLQTHEAYYIINHSVNHASIPPKKGFMRGISYLTGYYIVPTVEKSGKLSCDLTYVTQSDPKGKLPAWAVNKLTRYFAPKVMNRVQKACKGYEAWKAKHSPMHKPWLYPEQMTLARLRPEDILSIRETTTAEDIDETGILEDELELKDEDAAES